ncbi:MAG: hypothetical protein QXX38_01260 [Candidatus Aenigmatarchaeota archaeon]
MKAFSHVGFGLLTVFIATIMLFFVFDNIVKFSEVCKGNNPPETCKKFNSFSFSMLIVLLILSGFIIIICLTSYIMLSA